MPRESSLGPLADGVTGPYLFGPRYVHHASHSGYHAVAPWVGTMVRLPMAREEWRGQTSPRWRRRLDPRAAAKHVLRRVSGIPGYSLRSLLAELALALHMRTHRRALYHALHGDTDVWLTGPVARRSRHTLVATFHKPPDTLLEYPVARTVASLSGVILVSRYQAPVLQRLAPGVPTFVVPLGVDTAFFAPARTVVDDPVCITVGSHRRDYETLAEAMGLVWQVDARVRWIAVGTRHYVHSRLAVEDARVRYLEGVNDEVLREAYREARVAVFAFSDATANNSLVEAMACGLPVVATDVGGIPEYVGPDTALLCPLGDAATLAESVLRVLGDSRLAAAMGRAGRRRACDYELPRVARALRRAYVEVLGAR